jgi:phosphotransferase system enzyme I (PtsP)
MLEVPALLWQLDELMKAVDFVSVGSNDLFQFVTATDRGNALLSDRFDPLSVPFLRVLKQIADAGRKSGTPVTLCGELAGRPISAMTLVGRGYRSISMSPAAIGPVKAMLAELPAEELTTMLDDLLGRPDGGTNVRGLLEEFAGKHDIPL